MLWQCSYALAAFLGSTPPFLGYGIGDIGKVYGLLRPAFQRGPSGIGQDINSALSAVEPAINIVQQDLRCVGNLGLEIAHAPRSLRQRRGAGQRLLAIGRHDRRPRAPAQRRIALATLMFGDKARSLPGVAVRTCGGWFDNHLDIAGVGDREHAKAEPSAEIAVACIAFAALAARRHFGGEPDLVASAGAIHPLQHEFKIERELQFADDDDRRFVPAERNQVAAADFAFDGEAEAFEEVFDGQIERRFQAMSPAPRTAGEAESRDTYRSVYSSWPSLS